ncbi:MAG: DUF4976 domain-containing protein, partial [Anaerolineales bacterium]
AQLIDGRSMVPLLRGEQDLIMEERDLFWHYPHYGNQGGEPSSIIRSGAWKLIHYYEDGHDELYNLDADPGEQHNLYNTVMAKASEVRQRLDDWLVEVDAKFPTPDPAYDPVTEKTRLHELEHVLMPKLEAEHAEYLDPDWQPNDDWWGSQIITD